MFRTIAARGNGVAGIWGPAGASYDLTVYQRPRPEAAGPCGLAQGGIVLPPGQTATQTTQFVAGNLNHIAAVLNVSAVAGGFGPGHPERCHTLGLCLSIAQWVGCDGGGHHPLSRRALALPVAQRRGR